MVKQGTSKCTVLNGSESRLNVVADEMRNNLWGQHIRRCTGRSSLPNDRESNDAEGYISLVASTTLDNVYPAPSIDLACDYDLKSLVTSNCKPATESCWIIDSQATAHMTYDKSLFCQPPSGPMTEVSIGNDTKPEATGHGADELHLDNDGNERRCKLHKILYVASLKYHLLSVSAVCNERCTVEFDKEDVRIL